MIPGKQSQEIGFAVAKLSKKQRRKEEKRELVEVEASRKKSKRDRSKVKKQKQVVNRKERKVKESLNRAAERAAFDNILEEYTPDQGKFLLLHQYLLTAKYHLLIIIIL